MSWEGLASTPSNSVPHNDQYITLYQENISQIKASGQMEQEDLLDLITALVKLNLFLSTSVAHSKAALDD